jgi:hypothetical protein
MSKKNRKNRGFGQPAFAAPSQPATVSNELSSEYTVIKHDLIRVVVFNAVILAALLAVYYTNLHSQYLERWAAKLFHF